MKISKFFCILAMTGLVGASAMAAEAAEAQPEAQVEAQEEEQSCWGMRALRATGIYFANVFSDLSDIVTFEVSAGMPFEADVLATHYCEIGWEHSDTYFAGWLFDRQFGAGRRESERVAFLAWDCGKVYVSKCSGWMHESIAVNDPSFKLQNWNKAFYRDRDRDFWAIGARAGLFVGAGVEFHPVELADFCCSLITLDISGDNWQ